MKSMVMVVMLIVASTFFFADDLLTTVNGHEQNAVYAMGGRHPNPNPRPEPSPRPDGERRRRVNEPSTLAMIGTGVVGIGVYLLLRGISKKK
jgi:hypothetical protein